jgi:hypothetical protein
MRVHVLTSNSNHGPTDAAEKFALEQTTGEDLLVDKMANTVEMMLQFF